MYKLPKQLLWKAKNYFQFLHLFLVLLMSKISKSELAVIVNSQTQMMFPPSLLPFSLHSALLPLTSDLPPPLAIKSSQTHNNKIQIQKIYSKPLPHRNPQTPHDKSTLYRNPPPPPPPLTTKPKKKKKPQQMLQRLRPSGTYPSLHVLSSCD